MATGIPRTRRGGNAEGRRGLPEYGEPSNMDVSLSYQGKRRKEDVLSTPPAHPRQLWPSPNSSGTLETNRLYFGDNLPILALLLRDPTVRGKVRLVYIDPPFATRMIYQSRSLAHAYTDLLGGAHYVEFLRQRLILLHELLADDGSIYVHLDEQMAFYIKVIMDEIFGENNYQNWITRKKCNPKNYTRKTFGNVSDFILFYTKSREYIWNRPLEKWTSERAAKEYEYVEPHTGRRYKKVPLHAPGIRHGETGKPWREMKPPPGKHWQFPPSVLEEMDRRGEIYWSPNGNPRRKIYLDHSEGVPIQDIWLDCRDAHNQNVKISGYPTEKNPDMMARIVEASSRPGDLVLDCFCGSGTTLEVASRAGRRWIGIDNGQEAIATCLRRFAQGTRPMGDFVGRRNDRDEVEEETLPLFDLIANGEMVESRFPEQLQISDFALCSTMGEPPLLKAALTEWRRHLETKKPRKPALK